jgi:lincosamide and streptogramin A transport system ATP-binding/permease protein
LIEKELGKLRVNSDVLSRPYHTLSFGERTKLMLAALFLKKNNFLLIDEPTNHLDMEGRDTLAEYLRSKNGFILVSHDRNFLDRCIDHVLSINRTDIEVQKGNYSSWWENKERSDNYELDKNEQLKKEIVILSDAAKRAKGWSDQVEESKIGTHAPDRGAIGHKAAKMMKRAKAIENRKLDAIEEKKSLLKNIEELEDLKINILPISGRRLMEAKDLSLYFDERRVASDIQFSLSKGSRLAIQGKNGSGKTTLLKLLLGEKIDYQGRYYVAPSLKLSYVSQDTSYLTGNLRDFAVRYGLEESIYKTVLRQLDFTRVQFEKDISEFSAGQKKKVLLAKSLAEPAQVFIWDEPLNYIDIFSRMQIEELILKYQPTLIFVEHDRVFCERIATETVRLEQGEQERYY